MQIKLLLSLQKLHLLFDDFMPTELRSFFKFRRAQRSHFLEDLCYQTLTGNSVVGTKKCCDLLLKSETTKKRKSAKTNTEQAMDKLFQ